MSILIHGRHRYRSVSAIICGLLCLVWVGLAQAQGSKTYGQRPNDNGNRVRIHAGDAAYPKTEVLYYDRSEKMGVVKRDGKFFEVRFRKGDAYEWNELEGYPEELPKAKTHVEHFPERINTIENDPIRQLNSP